MTFPSDPTGSTLTNLGLKPGSTSYSGNLDMSGTPNQVFPVGTTVYAFGVIPKYLSTEELNTLTGDIIVKDSLQQMDPNNIAADGYPTGGIAAGPVPGSNTL